MQLCCVDSVLRAHLLWTWSKSLLMAGRFDQEAPEQAGALTTFGDIATRQELQEEEHEGLDHTVHRLPNLHQSERLE